MSVVCLLFYPKGSIIILKKVARYFFLFIFFKGRHSKVSKLGNLKDIKFNLFRCCPTKTLFCPTKMVSW